MPDRIIREAERLVSLSSDLENLARQIASRAAARPPLSEAERVAFAVAASRARARRAQFFPLITFGEPAWDMLLELYAADRQDRTVPVSSLCHASGVPSTTALRWLGALADAGYLTRGPDLGDGRRVLVRLTEQGRAAVDAWIDDAAAIGLV